MKPLQLALGVLAAVGGFVDIGDLVFASQAGAAFGYQLLWAVLLGTVGIITYSEMCGRVAVVGNRPVFEVVRSRMGFGFGFATLVASQLVNLLTVAAEVGGIALTLQMASAWPYRVLVVVAFLMLVVAIGVLSFEGLERVFGFGGLLLVTFTVAALQLRPDWGGVASGLVPNPPDHGYWLIYAYFAVGLASAALMPYEVHFYSSGDVEDGLLPSELAMNRMTSVVGFALGSILSMSLVLVAAQFFLARGIEPDFLGSVVMAAETPLGEVGLLLAIAGIFFAVSGAAIDTALAGAYNAAQFFGWEWGKYRGARGAPLFTLTWVAFLVAAVVILMTGIDPILITEYSVIFAVVALPLTYLPVLAVARDRGFMGEYANGPISNALGWFYLGLIVVLALTAVPLMVLTNMGQG